MTENPIAWTALNEGTSVVAVDGTELGKVSHVVADEQKDIFSGIAVKAGLLDAPVFVPADLIDEITDDAVRVRLSAVEAEALQPYEG